MSATITIIVVPSDVPDDLERMYIDERKRESEEWQEFPLSSGRLLDTFLMKATNTDLGILACADREDDEVPLKTRLLIRRAVPEALPDLEELVEKNPEATARALRMHGGSNADVDLILSTLKSGTWPTSGDPAVEAAAFAHQLLRRARQAIDVKMAVCWEFRGDVKV